MPDNAYYFYSNITFIESLKDLRLDVKRQSCNELYKSCNRELMKLELVIVRNYNEENNNVLKNKIKKNINNISTAFKALNDKVNKSDKTVKFITNEAKKLKKSAEGKIINDNDCKKSKILYNKLMHTPTSLQMIEDIFEKAIEKIKDINTNLKTRPIISLDMVKERLKEILALTGEYNIAKLKRAQQKFEESKELRDFRYGKVHPKLAQLLSLDSAVKLPEYIDGETKRYKLKTPFGSVWVGNGKYGNGRIISLKEDKEDAPNYDKMCEELDRKFDPEKTKIKKYRDDAIVYLIKPIIGYINQRLTVKQNLIGLSNPLNPQALLKRVKHRYTISKYLTISQKEAAAFLCGVLLLSESHEFRNPTGGKFERKAMENVLQLAENNCLNPFGVVFNGEKGRYIPAHSARQAKTKAGKITGGQKQMQLLLRGETPITTFLKNNEFSPQNLEKAKNTFFDDYILNINKYLQNKLDRKDIKFGKNHLHLEQKKRNNLSPDAQQIIEKVEMHLDFLLNKFGGATNENYMIKIKDLPDIPDEAIIVQFKKLILENNVSRINKLMNNSLR